MNIQWTFVTGAAWTVFWVTCLYSYSVCVVVAGAKRLRTPKSERIDYEKYLESFIVSPFYVATLFALFAVLLFSRGVAAMAHSPDYPVRQMLALGAIVWVGHLVLEVVESTVTKRQPLRILRDKDALRLSAISLVVIGLTTASAALSA